ncbi:MAG: hypothetical protein AAB551_00975 [Patescibacteria group bacterium]
MSLDSGPKPLQEGKEFCSKSDVLVIGNSQAGGVAGYNGFSKITEVKYVEGALLKIIQQEERKIRPDLKAIVLFPQSRNGENALRELRSVMDFLRGKAPNAKFIIATPTPLNSAPPKNPQERERELIRRNGYAALLASEISQGKFGDGVELYDTGAAFRRFAGPEGIQYNDDRHLKSVEYKNFAKDMMRQFGIGMPIDRAREITGGAAADLAKLRPALPKYTRNFTPEETERFKKATGKEKLDYDTVSKMSLEEIDAAEKKDPGLFAAIFVEKNTFRTQGNESAEWEKGLADILEEKVRGVRLYIRIENLDKGQNDQRYKGGKGLERKTVNGQEYVIVESTSRDENGDFYNGSVYMAIFEGDFWEVTKEWTPEEIKAHQEAKIAKQRVGRETKVREFNIDIAGLTEVQIDEKIAEKQKEKYAEMLKNGGWSKLMGDAMETVGLPKTALAQAIGWAMVEVESGFRPDSKYEGKVIKSDAAGLGAFLSKSRREMYRLLKSDRVSVPESADGEFKDDPKWQLMCLAKLIKNNSERFKKIGIDVFSGKPRDIAFLYLAHHEGAGGVKMYLNWWKSNGSPENIPEFPDLETANKFAVARHQKDRPLVRPRIGEGTNQVLATANKVGSKALDYSNNPDKLIAILNKKEQAFVDRMAA